MTSITLQRLVNLVKIKYSQSIGGPRTELQEKKKLTGRSLVVQNEGRGQENKREMGNKCQSPAKDQRQLQRKNLLTA